MKKHLLLLASLLVLAGIALTGCAVDGTVEGKASGRASTSPSVFPWAESQPAK